MTNNVFVQLGIALLLGLLVGLQREKADGTVAGIRTFPIIALFGALCAVLAEIFGAWVLAAGVIAVAVLFVIGNLARIQAGDIDPGLTTEFAGVLMFAVGACVVAGPMPVAVAAGGATAILLQLKAPMHRFVDQVGESDMKAVMQFTLITLVVLPVLPNRTYGPYDVLNPFQVWLMVVLIVGISMTGYVAYKLFGQRAGSLLGGLLGGLISSTATTVSFSRRAKTAPVISNMAAGVIMLASTTVFLRVLIEIGAVAAGSFRQLAPPLAIMLVTCILISLAAFRFGRQEAEHLPEQGNPAELRSALVFAAVYAVVILAIAAAKDHFGPKGLYVVAVLSGLTDMDAVTLSTAQLVEHGRLPAAAGWRTILVASVSNLVFKTIIVGLLGGRVLFKRMAVLFGLAIAAGTMILWFWP
jgi:uncharacterized membrane protein (DUF4010 family)